MHLRRQNPKETPIAGKLLPDKPFYSHSEPVHLGVCDKGLLKQIPKETTGKSRTVWNDSQDHSSEVDKPAKATEGVLIYS